MRIVFINLDAPELGTQRWRPGHGYEERLPMED
jgi:hypothetical protein